MEYKNRLGFLFVRLYRTLLARGINMHYTQLGEHPLNSTFTHIACIFLIYPFDNVRGAFGASQ